jgi:apolipoprotein N-acyltransferase
LNAWLRVGATLVSAAVYVAAFPPVAWRFLAWGALVPLLCARRDSGLAGRLGLGALWTIASGVGLGTWMPEGVSHYTQQPLWVGWLILGFTICTALPFYMGFAAAYRPLARLPFGPWFAAAALVAAELARNRLLNGSPIYLGVSSAGSLGYSQASVLPVVQVASVLGVYGVSFVLTGVNASLAEVWTRLHRVGHFDARCRSSVLWASMVMTIVVGGGLLSLRGGVDLEDPNSVEIALVQAGLEPAQRWGREGAYRTLEVHLRMTGELAVDETPPALVFWPEAAVTFFLEEEALYRESIVGLLAKTRMELVLGAPRAARPGGPPYHNSIYVMDGESGIRGRYDKQYLLPFMEYFPVGIDILRRSFGPIRVFEPGPLSAPLPTRAGQAGIIVCNEGMLPQFAAAQVRAGAEYLVNPSNDGWIRHPSYLGQQFDLVTFRAIEQRRSLVRVNDVGPSAIVDPWGRVVGRTGLLEAEVLRGRIVPRSTPSIYGRTGDVFASACVLATLVALVWAKRRDALAT